MMSITFLVLLVSIVLLIRKLRSPLRAIPSPGGLPIIGKSIEIFSEDAGKKELEWVLKYGPVVRYGYLIFESVLIASPDLIKHVIITNEHNYSKRTFAYTNFREQLGDGLVTMVDVDEHKRVRQLANGAFKFSSLKAYYPIFTEMGSRLVERWSKIQESGKAIDLRQEITLCTLDVIGRAAFGVDLDTMSSEELSSSSPSSPKIPSSFSSSSSSRKSSSHDDRPDGARILDLLKGVFNDFSDTIGLLDIMPLYIKRHFKIYQRQVESTLMLDEEMKRIIHKKKKKRDAKTSSSSSEEQQQEHQQDILDILVRERGEDGSELSIVELTAQSKTFLLAGHETTSTTLDWAFVVLNLYPDIEAKLVSEIEAKVGLYRDNSSAPAPPSIDVIESMRYLNNFIKELLRVYPPVAYTFRTCEADAVVGGYVILRGTTIIISPYVMHHHPAYWNEPEKFDPDRWDDDLSVNMPAGVYFPFWLGSRNCIGNKFAILELKVLLVMLLQRFHLHTTPGLLSKLGREFIINMHPSPRQTYTLQSRQ
eukprot:TRINITY_DN2962_c0_g2_i2.p1 TRINITY_DN2962_c0_g2~~TRINITY_DN2962_c0_g2_i2.p1  ORF type:complete len:535 (+),score=128.35 TRINITY_DN2962_c0_g2_i2:66-1670(+)